MKDLDAMLEEMEAEAILSRCNKVVISTERHDVLFKLLSISSYFHRFFPNDIPEQIKDHLEKCYEHYDFLRWK